MCYDRKGVCRKACSVSVFARKATLAQLVERLIRNETVLLNFQVFAALVDGEVDNSSGFWPKAC